MPTFDEAFGTVLREIREEHDASQEEVAAAAREVGLAWHQPTVAAIEAGRRGMELQEALRLSSILRRAFGGRPAPSLPELLDRMDQTDVTMSGGVIALKGGVLRSMLTRPAGPSIGAHDLKEAQLVSNDMKANALVKASRRLGVDPWILALAVRKRYGRSLTEERDARLRTDSGDKETRRALRGHITRQLLEELEPYVRHGGKRKR